MALTYMLSERAGFNVQVMYTDEGIVLRFADSDTLPNAAMLLPDPLEIDGLVAGQLADTTLFAALFRENAARALLFPRRNPTRHLRSVRIKTPAYRHSRWHHRRTRRRHPTCIAVRPLLSLRLCGSLLFMTKMRRWPSAKQKRSL
jgi:Lhr-like helicase